MVRGFEAESVHTMSDQRDGGIAWTDQTWNPVRGCSRVSAGCDNCYAMFSAHRFQTHYRGLTVLRPANASRPGVDWSGIVRMVPEHVDDPLRWKRPRRVFVNSMSDLFHESLPFESVAAIFGVMAAAGQHQFQVLTKRPKRARAFFDWCDQLSLTTTREVIPGVHLPTTILKPAGFSALPIQLKCIAERYLAEHHPASGIGPWADCGLDVRRDKSDPLCFAPVDWPLPNVWLGVSVENQATAEERLPHLMALPAAVRFVSAEPLLDRVDLSRLAHELHCDKWTDAAFACNCHRLDWVIVGGESGARPRPFDIAWAHELVSACRKEQIAVFVKQLGAYPYDSIVSQKLTLQSIKGADPSEWPADLRVQEMPR
jgi:protein gp37